MPDGVDISEHDAGRQGNVAWQPQQFAAYDFAIIRAFNEWANPDKYVAQHWANAEGQTLRGIYGWPVPGRDNWALGAQLVDLYPDAEAGYWADREISGAGQATEQEVGQYLRGIESAGGKAGFYSNIGECPRTVYLDDHDWWMADYGPNNGQRHDPFEQPPIPARPYTIHQYSSFGALDRNWSENLDWTGATDVPLSEADFDRINLIVLGHILELAGGANLDGSLVSTRILEEKIEALEGGQGGAVDYAAIAKAVNDDAAARLKD